MVALPIVIVKAPALPPRAQRSPESLVIWPSCPLFSMRVAVDADQGRPGARGEGQQTGKQQGKNGCAKQLHGSQPKHSPAGKMRPAGR